MKYILIALLMAGCTKCIVQKEPTAPEPAKLVEARWERKSSSNKKWTEHTFKQIKNRGSKLLSSKPKDINRFCPNYDKLSTHNKINFWTMVVSGIAEFESAHRPSVKYKESFKDQKNESIYSRGLLQLSIESSKGYKCGFRNEQAIHEPLQNLTCGVIILDRWVGRDGCIACGKIRGKWRGGGRYWSVLRKDKRINPISGWTKDFCKSVK